MQSYVIAGGRKFGGRRISLKQVKYGRMLEAWSQNPLQSGMDLGEQAANAVAGLRDLRGEIVIETWLAKASIIEAGG